MLDKLCVSKNTDVNVNLLQVFVGRPALWGLALGGQVGVERMLKIFRTELEYTFNIAGILKSYYLLNSYDLFYLLL